MEVGIDRKKVEERESAMRTSQLDGLVGYERIFSIICSLMYPRVPQKYSLKNSRIWSIRCFSSPPGPVTTLRVLLPFLQTNWTAIIGYMPLKIAPPSKSSKQFVPVISTLKTTTSRTNQTDLGGSRGSRRRRRVDLNVQAVRKVATWKKVKTISSLNIFCFTGSLSAREAYMYAWVKLTFALRSS